MIGERRRKQGLSLVALVSLRPKQSAAKTVYYQLEGINAPRLSSPLKKGGGGRRKEAQ